MEGAETLKSFEDVVNNVFIMPQVFLDRVFFKKVQFKDTTFRPVDPGLGDPDSFPMVNLYRRIVNKSNLNKRERQFLLDHEFYFGNRSGGPPCKLAVTVLEKGKDSKPWKSVLPFCGQLVRNSARLLSIWKHHFK